MFVSLLVFCSVQYYDVVMMFLGALVDIGLGAEIDLVLVMEQR